MPELPVRFLTYILPPGMKAGSVSIKSCEYKLIGDYYSGAAVSAP